MSATSMSAFLKGMFLTHPPPSILRSLPGNREPERNKLTDLYQCLPRVTLCISFVFPVALVFPFYKNYNNKTEAGLNRCPAQSSVAESPGKRDAKACAVVGAEFDAVGSCAFYKKSFKCGIECQKLC